METTRHLANLARAAAALLLGLAVSFAIGEVMARTYFGISSRGAGSGGWVSEAQGWGLPALNNAARISDRGLYYPIDGHWSHEGHTVAANEIAKYLAKRFPWATQTALVRAEPRP